MAKGSAEHMNMKNVHEQVFFYYQGCVLSQYVADRERVFFQKLNYWNILASEFVSSPLRNPCGSSRCDEHPDFYK